MTAARVVAFAIAILAVLDPSLTTSRSSRPLVSVIAVDSAQDASLVRRVEGVLARQFTVVRGTMPAASGTVLVGDRLPDEGAAGPLMMVTPARGTPFLHIVGLDAPATPSVNAQVPIAATVVVRGARGRRLNVEAHVGEMRVAQQSMAIEHDTLEAEMLLHHVPTTAEATLLRVSARIEGTNIADEATTSIDATADRLAVLFFEPRASWLSTFVRRAAEGDPRFTVTHRVVTSRGMSNSGGPAPVSLRDAASLSTYGTIVVGSPEQLNDADVSGLETFMRDRGGRVVLLMDRRAAGPIDRLTGASGWRAARLPGVAILQNESSPARRVAFHTLRAQEIAWPSTLPRGAFVSEVSVARDSTRRPVVWSVPVGAGRLLVSGALDAWHHRDEASGFDLFWTTAIAELSASAPSALELNLTNRTIAPGQTTTITAWIRDAALPKRSDRSATVSAVLAGPSDTTNLRLWPGNSPGTFTGSIVAPRVQGTYRVLASSGTDRSEASLVVDPSAHTASRDERHLMPAYAASRKGRVIPEGELTDLPRELSSAIQSVSRVETWYPMRSAWWILPFALLLGAEWWARRRRGLA
jgi:hypothetical protein